MKTIISTVFKHEHNLKHTVKLHSEDNKLSGYSCVECDKELTGKLTLVDSVPHQSYTNSNIPTRLTVVVDDFAEVSNGFKGYTE